MARFAALLSAHQIIGWGTTFNAPAALWRPIGAELDLSKEWVFAGTAVMLIIGALLSPRVGRFLDRHGCREGMAAGSALAALGNLTIAVSGSAAGWFLGWVVIGLATPLAMTQGAYAAMAQHAGPHARFGMALISVFTAMSPSLSWPAAAGLESLAGWRGTYLVFAALNIMVALPLALLAVPRGPGPGAAAEAAGDAAARRVPDALRPRAIALFAAASALQGFASWGMFLHIIGVLEALGHATATALVIAALKGPATVAARASDLIASRHMGAVDVAVLALAVTVAALTALPLMGRDPVAAALLLCLYSFGVGALALTRATAPLELFGRDGYATVVGRIGLTQHIAFAIAPTAFAAFLDAGGPLPTLLLAAALSLVSLGLMLRLRRIARPG